MSGTAIVWFKRDLRTTDHPALARAVGLGLPILPLYIVEPGLWEQPTASGRHYTFLRETVNELSAALARLGAPLVIRVGAAVEVLEALRLRHAVTHLFSHEETGDGWTYRRDRSVAAWAAGQGVVWEESPQSGVVRRLKSRDGWAKQRDSFVFAAPVPEPGGLRGVAAPSDPWPEPGALGLAPDLCPGLQPGGRSEATGLLESFLTERGQDYRRAMSSPLTGAEVCSRLSAHLALGALSVREAALAAAERQRAVRGTREGWIGALKSFQSRLAWRDHFIQKLEDEPAWSIAACTRLTRTCARKSPMPAVLRPGSRARPGCPSSMPAYGC